MGKLLELLKGLLGGNLGGNLTDSLSNVAGSKTNFGMPSQTSRSQESSTQEYRQEFRPQNFTKKVRRTEAESAQFKDAHANSAQFNKPNTASAPLSKPQPASSQPASAQVKPSFSNKKQKI